MLGSITPLGERGRKQRWAATVSWFLLGSVAGGATAGAILGGAGSLALRARVLSTPVRLAALAVLLGAGAFLDSGLVRIALPTNRRQVNEDWLSRYRGWVYGGAFGLQLGLGVVTVVSTSAVYSTFLAAFLSGGLLSGALIGATFGLLRATPQLVTARVKRPDDLVRMDRTLRAWDRPARRWAVALEVAVAASALMVAMT